MPQPRKPRRRGTLSRNIERLIQHRETTQRELATKARLPYANVNAYCTGRRTNPKTDVILALCHTLKCWPGDLDPRFKTLIPEPAARIIEKWALLTEKERETITTIIEQLTT